LNHDTLYSHSCATQAAGSAFAHLYIYTLQHFAQTNAQYKTGQYEIQGVKK
jgi:hypothetical protein